MQQRAEDYLAEELASDPIGLSQRPRHPDDGRIVGTRSVLPVGPIDGAIHNLSSCFLVRAIPSTGTPASERNVTSSIF
jgi:hypothetical protein